MAAPLLVLLLKLLQNGHGLDFVKIKKVHLLPMKKEGEPYLFSKISEV